MLAHHWLQVRRRNGNTDPGAPKHAKVGGKGLPECPQRRVMDFNRELANLGGREARGSAQRLAQLTLESKPGYFPKAIPGRDTNQHRSAPGYQARQLVGSQVQVRNTVQP